MLSNARKPDISILAESLLAQFQVLIPPLHRPHLHQIRNYCKKNIQISIATPQEKLDAEPFIHPSVIIACPLLKINLTIECFATSTSAYHFFPYCTQIYGSFGLAYIWPCLSIFLGRRKTKRYTANATMISIMITMIITNVVSGMPRIEGGGVIRFAPKA